jgi:hypothetical protein
MYPSGSWAGFWEQAGWGRQRMTAFELHFADGRVTGRGTDVVGPFTIAGEYETTTGKVAWVKQYVGKHRVLYAGLPDGEGSILGTWTVDHYGVKNTGPFLLKPHISPPGGNDPIREIPKSERRL